MKKNKKPGTKKEDSLFKSVMLAYVVLILHVMLLSGIVLLVIFFRGVVQYMLWIFLGFSAVIIASGIYFYKRMKAQGKTLKQMMSDPLFEGRPVEVSLLGGMASFRLGLPNPASQLETKQTQEGRQLEDMRNTRIQELEQLAQLLENELITRDEYNEAKKSLFKQKE